MTPWRYLRMSREKFDILTSLVHTHLSKKAIVARLEQEYLLRKDWLLQYDTWPLEISKYHHLVFMLENLQCLEY